MRIGADFIYYIVFQIDRLSIRHRKLAIILVAVRQGEGVQLLLHHFAYAFPPVLVGDVDEVDAGGQAADVHL